jgi:tRNA dimethylallyltransferase
MATRPLIVIVGPTASGKTELAIKLAKRFDGEIICADSRTIYKDMDIGTAKPTPKEQKIVKHWGIDLVEPGERFTVADFQKYANEKIADIRCRSKQPFLVGGSGLYVDSVLFGYEFGKESDGELRKELNKMSVQELQKHCKNNNIILPENYKNKRYLMRAIECQSVVKNNRKKMRNDAIVVGITISKEELMRKIKTRVNKMFNDELFDEVKRLAGKYQPESEPMKSNIYPIVQRLLNGEISRGEALKLSEIDDWHLARKQMTWFRRNPEIKWLAVDEIEPYLNKKFAQGM